MFLRIARAIFTAAIAVAFVHNTRGWVYHHAPSFRVIRKTPSRVQVRCAGDPIGYQRTSLSADSLFERVVGDWDTKLPRQRVWGRFVVDEGKQVALWSRSGSMTKIDGPKSMILFGTAVQPLVKYVAGPNEFINILRKDGTREVLRGPTFLWQDPVHQQHVTVHRALNINNNEALLVYQESQGRVSRRVVIGPALFTPQGSSEWVQQFVWHGVDPDLKHHGINRKVNGGLRFTKLRLIPDQLYFDVEKVRSKDDALLTVKTMIFFQLDDIEKMADSTHDVVSELINSISADIIEKTSSLTFDEFRAAAGDFSKLETYAGLVAKAKGIGYTISKVVFRGYEASDTLQSMHDRAIESRTQLRLDTEKEEQEQDLKDYRQLKELQRELEIRKEEERVTQHSTKMNAMKIAAQLQKSRDMEEQRLALQEKADQHAGEVKRQDMKVLEEHYAALQGMGVDLTKYLADKPHRTVRFDSGSSDVAVQYHMHDPSPNNGSS